MTSDEDTKGFQVRDRRRFTAEGDSREDAPTGESPPAQEASAAGTERTEEGSTEEAAQSDAEASGLSASGLSPDDEPGPEITLSAFLMSLSTQALFCLGEIPDPLEGKLREDLRAARELIDIVAMLQEKTRGNLDAEETRLVEDILFDLRMRYVKKARK